MLNKITDKKFTHECPICKYKIKIKQNESPKKECPACKKEVTFKKIK